MLFGQNPSRVGDQIGTGPGDQPAEFTGRCLPQHRLTQPLVHDRNLSARGPALITRTRTGFARDSASGRSGVAAITVSAICMARRADRAQQALR